MGSEYLVLFSLPPAIALGVGWEWAWKKHAETVERQKNCHHAWEDKRTPSHYGSVPYRECSLCGLQDHTPTTR